ncbi:hypothetical protein M9H77_21363 [Catharanthus roseus]|uniref:Uncharacterized protein n=1 Tax=Catharanthus roseus TaxID=4058 RepID=A0ACC0ANU4_CATRO|nr:hypothetical protein M9H77_21363 [Catharanthus roseus]
MSVALPFDRYTIEEADHERYRPWLDEQNTEDNKLGEDKGRKSIVLKVNEDDHICLSNNEDEIEDMALVMRKFKRFYKKYFNTRGKNPPFKKGGQTDCSKAIEKEKGALEEKLEALKRKKKVKGLIGTWDQDSSESEGEEKANLCFTAIENEVQSTPPNLSNHADDNDDDLNSLIIEMYGECKKVSKRNKDLKNKTQVLLDENSKLIYENKTLLESLEILKNEKECSNKNFQKLVLENKNLCEKVSSLEKCLIDYESLKKKLSFNRIKEAYLKSQSYTLRSKGKSFLFKENWLLNPSQKSVIRFSGLVIRFSHPIFKTGHPIFSKAEKSNVRFLRGIIRFLKDRQNLSVSKIDRPISKRGSSDFLVRF